MDTRFSSAIHMMILISESDHPMTSEQIAESVGTNPSYIRKITSLLKKKGLVESRPGISGFALKRKPQEITLFMIYEAVEGTDQVHIFDLHQNPSDACIVGRHIRPVLQDVFRDAEEKAEQELKETTLSDCIERMRKEIDRSEVK